MISTHPRYPAIAILLSSLIFAACGGAPSAITSSSPGATSSSAPTATSTAPVKVSIVQGSAGMVWMPIHVARQKGYFKEENLDVEITVTGGGAKATQALVTGASDFAATTMLDIINARSNGAPAVVIAPLLRQYPTDVVLRKDVADRLHITSTSPEADRIKALKGLKIGLGGRGSPTDQLIQWLARRGGFDGTKDVDRVFLSTDQAVLAALKNKSIDAFAYGPPTSTTAVDSGDAIFLFDIVGKKDLPEIADFPNTVLATTEGFLAKNATVALHVARAYVKAIKYMNAFPDEVASVIKPLYADTSAQVFTDSFNAAKNGFPKTPSISSADVKQLIDFSQVATGATISVTPDSVVSAALVQRAAKELESWTPTR